MTKMNKRRSQFQKGSGCYTCGCCGKQTREVDQDAASCRLCVDCYEQSCWENLHSDEGHEAPTGQRDPGCPICQKQLAEAEGFPADDVAGSGRRYD